MLQVCPPPRRPDIMRFLGRHHLVLAFPPWPRLAAVLPCPALLLPPPASSRFCCRVVEMRPSLPSPCPPRRSSNRRQPDGRQTPLAARGGAGLCSSDFWRGCDAELDQRRARRSGEDYYPPPRRTGSAVFQGPPAPGSRAGRWRTGPLSEVGPCRAPRVARTEQGGGRRCSAVGQLRPSPWSPASHTRAGGLDRHGLPDGLLQACMWCNRGYRDGGTGCLGGMLRGASCGGEEGRRRQYRSLGRRERPGEGPPAGGTSAGLQGFISSAPASTVGGISLGVLEILDGPHRATMEHALRGAGRVDAIHGHTRVPFDVGALGWWVSRQRQASRKHKLLQSRRDRLDALVFVWSPHQEERGPSGNGGPTPTRPASELAFHFPTDLGDGGSGDVPGSTRLLTSSLPPLGSSGRLPSLQPLASSDSAERRGEARPKPNLTPKPKKTLGPNH